MSNNPNPTQYPDTAQLITNRNPDKNPDKNPDIPPDYPDLS